jgi:dephospho-CoA kinase
MQSKSGKRNKPIRVGITGGIGSGKTIVTKIFSLLSVPVYYADERAKWLLENNAEVKEGLIRLFGPASFSREGINRKFIAEQIFNDERKLNQLNALVHPEVGKDFEEWAEGQYSSDYILKEAALMFESGSYKLLDLVITVFSPEDLRIKRILERDPHRTKEDILKIIARQMNEEEKIKKSSYVIYNDEKQLLITQVLKLDSIIREML